MDTRLREAGRRGDLAALQRAEVQAGRPERARLLAYLGCEVARALVGEAPTPDGWRGCWIGDFGACAREGEVWCGFLTCEGSTIKRSGLFAVCRRREGHDGHHYLVVGPETGGHYAHIPNTPDAWANNLARLAAYLPAEKQRRLAVAAALAVGLGCCAKRGGCCGTVEQEGRLTADAEWLDDLERGLEGVTPGPWERDPTDPHEPFMIVAWGPNGYEPVARGSTNENAAYLARCYPDNIRRLIALARREALLIAWLRAAANGFIETR